MRLRLDSRRAPWPTYNNSGRGIYGWRAGEAREVSDEVASYLLGTFPGLFVEVVSEPPSPVVENRMMPVAEVRKVAALADLHHKTLKAEIASGEHDSDLRELLKIERRPSVLRAIRARLATAG